MRGRLAVVDTARGRKPHQLHPATEQLLSKHPSLLGSIFGGGVH